MAQKPPYKPIVQLPYHCVPACISMVLDRRKLKHGSQEEIGYELGLVVPPPEKHLFKKVRIGKKPVAGYGTQVAKKQFSINNFFRKHKIDLQEKYYPVKSVSNVSKFIADNLKNSDILVCFNNKLLFGSGNYGHVSLIQGLRKDEVILIDPEQSVPKRRKVELLNLIRAMKVHAKKRRGGFWVISK